MAKKDRTPFHADDAITAEILDLAPELIERHGWWAARGVLVGDDRPLTVLTALARAAIATVGESPFLFDHIEEATGVLKASLKLEESPLKDELIEWNNTQESAEAVTDALRFASLALRFAA